MNGDRRTVAPPISATPAATSTSGIRRIIPTASGDRVAGSPVTDLPASIVSRFVPSRSSWSRRSARDEPEIPVTPTIAAIPIAIPSADRLERTRRIRRPRNPSPSASRRRRSAAGRSRRPLARSRRDPAVEDPDPTRRGRGHGLAVGDDRDRRARPVELAQQLEDLGAGDAVEAAGRLVGEDDRRSPDDRPRDRDPLPLAARQLVRAVAQPVAEPDPLERVDRPLPSLASRRSRGRATPGPRSPRRSGRRGGRTAGRRTRSTSPGGLTARGPGVP